MHFPSSLKVAGAFALALVAVQPAVAAPFFTKATQTEGIPAGGPFVPAGTLFDNEQSNGTTSLASQESSGASGARSADDFIIGVTGCASNTFDVTQIRIQMVQADTAPQAFAVDLYNDDGTGNAPTAGINPFVTVAQTSQTNFGPFGAGTSIFEATLIPGAPIQLTGGTKYWISGFGASAATNPSSFNNFFAASAGAAATSPNGVVIAPGAGVTSWTRAELVTGEAPLHFAFAIDGTCAEIAGGGEFETTFDVAVPTLSTIGIAVLSGLLALVAFVMLRRN